jgi:hypothetical protein
MKALGLHTANPPSLWLPCLVEALQMSGEQTLLLLDDFMSSGPDMLDTRLLEAIKAQIRSTRVIVVVLSQSKPSTLFHTTPPTYTSPR